MVTKYRKNCYVLRTKPQNKSEIIDSFLNKYSKKNSIKDRTTIEANGINFKLFKKSGKIKLILGKYHRVHKSPKRKKILSKSKLRSVTTAKNINTSKK